MITRFIYLGDEENPEGFHELVSSYICPTPGTTVTFNEKEYKVDTVNINLDEHEIEVKLKL